MKASVRSIWNNTGNHSTWNLMIDIDEVVLISKFAKIASEGI